MKNLALRFAADLSWKSWSAITLFGCGFLGLAMGVEVSERSGLLETGLLTKAYYRLGLFVLGGLDLGTPTNGPLVGRTLQWVAYFGAPAWTASAILETILSALRPPVWHVRNIEKKIVYGLRLRKKRSRTALSQQSPFLFIWHRRPAPDHYRTQGSSPLSYSGKNHSDSPL